MKARYYVTYCCDPAATNAAIYHAGIGRTNTEAEQNSCYWANQPTRTVPVSRAPRWAIWDAKQALRNRHCVACGGPRHPEPCVDRFGTVLPTFARRAQDWYNRDRPPLLADGEEVIA